MALKNDFKKEDPNFISHFSANWKIVYHGIEQQSSSPSPFQAFSFSCVTQDSREISPSSLFVAVTCDHVLAHVTTAIQSRPVAIVIEEAVFLANQSFMPKSIYILVENARLALSQLAAEAFPAQPDQIYAVTGTNGKSSVVTFVRQMVGSLGAPIVSLGTVGMEKTPLDLPASPFAQAWEELKKQADLPKLTTPDAVSLHRVLSLVKGAGINHFALEASSHGLDQCRLHSVGVTVAAFTNLTQDHLDYHGTMESYFQAKEKLFTQILRNGGTAVLNTGSSYSRSLALLLAQRSVTVVTYGVEKEADLAATGISLTTDGMSFDLSWKGDLLGRYQVSLAGDFQLENVLCATLMTVGGGGYTLEEALSTYPSLKSAKGRMELVGKTAAGASIYVDYAHTPDALLRALQALRCHVEGTDSSQLHLIFGCGGNRDASKRHVMGDIAQRFADQVIVTDDNPRDEDPAYIRAQILAHCPKGKEVPDRHEAIIQGIRDLGSQDVLLIAGKGHEQGQILRDRILPFDDAQVVQEVLSR